LNGRLAQEVKLMKRAWFLPQRTPGPLWALVVLAGLAAACNLPGRASEAPLPTLATRAVVEVPEATITPSRSAPQATPAPVTESATLTPVATATATTAPTRTPSPTATATAELPAAGETFAPGQRDTGQLAEGGFRVYPFAGAQFVPVAVFAEADSGLDLALELYDRPVSAPGEGQPVSQANFSGDGRPEILVFSPDETAEHSLVVRAVAGSGGYTVYVFDTYTESPWGTLRQEQLAQGASSTFPVRSSGARPVVILAEPESRADLILQLVGLDGTLLAAANYGGPGSAEALFVLPMSQTEYTLQVTEAGGAATGFRLAIVALNGSG
jgi:hypothetical protein